MFRYIDMKLNDKAFEETHLLHQPANCVTNSLSCCLKHNSLTNDLKSLIIANHTPYNPI